MFHLCEHIGTLTVTKIRPPEDGEVIVEMEEEGWIHTVSKECFLGFDPQVGDQVILGDDDDGCRGQRSYQCAARIMRCKERSSPSCCSERPGHGGALYM